MSNKTSDRNVVSEDDLEELYDVLLHHRETEEVRIAIKHLLAERKQDKKKIQELEADLYSANCTISDYVDSIPKQKVKDKIGVLEVEEKYDYLDNKKAIQTLEELLEDK